MSSTDASAEPDDTPGIEPAEAQGLLFEGDFSPLPVDLGFRGPVACSAAGITYRQLDYWARTGLVVPEVRSASGSGSQRLYSFRDILILKVIKRLIDAGISLQQIRTAIEHLRARGVQDLTQVTLMSDGVSVFECTSDDEVIDLLRGGQGVFGIALGGVWRDIEGTLASCQPSEPRRTSPICQTMSSLSVGRHAPPVDGVIWALLERQRGRVHHLRRRLVAPKGQHPRNLSGSKTAHAMATLEPRVTEGECCSRKREHVPAHARRKLR